MNKITENQCFEEIKKCFEFILRKRNHITKVGGGETFYPVPENRQLSLLKTVNQFLF